MITAPNLADSEVRSTAPAPLPPPPPPPPPPMATTPLTFTKSAPRVIEPAKPDPRSELLDSIKGFQGLKSLKPAGVNSHETLSPEPANPAPPENSILDQLKNELVKRAMFLSKFKLVNFSVKFFISCLNFLFFQDDSDDDEYESDSEWQ
jgi:hypothetical protein